MAASNEAEAIRIATDETPDLILLDLHLGSASGFEVCERLRSSPKTNHIPIIILTGENDRNTTVRGLLAGADDFLCKPFHWDELRARVHARLRRHEMDRDISEPSRYGNLKMDPKTKQGWISDRNIELTQFEFRMLAYFIKHRNELVERRKMLGDLWPDAVVSRRTIDTHIAHLRKKLRGFSGSLETVYGGGYMLKLSETDATQHEAEASAASEGPPAFV